MSKRIFTEHGLNVDMTKSTRLIYYINVRNGYLKLARLTNIILQSTILLILLLVYSATLSAKFGCKLFVSYSVFSYGLVDFYERIMSIRRRLEIQHHFKRFKNPYKLSTGINKKYVK